MPGKQLAIVLKGETCDYIFEPFAKNTKLRKASKFSNVYRGKSTQGKDVVIKVLSKELSENIDEVNNFKAETQWYNVHPDLLAPFEYIYQDGRDFLILEYLPGIDLSTYIKKKSNFRKTRINLAIECGFQMLNALDVIHKLGKIHADIKPANVMLAGNKNGKIDVKNPKFKLLDFGMVRNAMLPPPTSNYNLRPPFVLMYSPPEQILGFNDITSYHSDLHNLALLMYEIIIKEPVYEVRISTMLINLQLSYALPTKKQIPTELMTILHKASSKPKFTRPHNHYKKSEAHALVKEAVDNRYQNTTEFRKDLLEFKNKWAKI